MTPSAMITLDMKKNRIRIHKATLDLLKKPQNIHILINPDTSSLVIRPTPDNIKDSLKISYRADSDCEFYSTDLMEQLLLLKPQLNTSCTYRIVGKIVSEKRIAIFDISEAALYDGSVMYNAEAFSRRDDDE